MIILRFVGGSGLASAAIRFAEYGFWATHVDAVLPDGRYFGAHYRGGVRSRPQGYDKQAVRREQFVRLSAPAALATSFRRFLSHQDGKPYDGAALCGFITRRDWRSPHRWFCSELIAAALESSGVLPPLAATVDLITPRDLLLALSARSDVEFSK